MLRKYWFKNKAKQNKKETRISALEIPGIYILIKEADNEQITKSYHFIDNQDKYTKTQTKNSLDLG